jgi:transcription initiation factor TFIIIB Brf1 subunit/transcription initiation factor TFIIB
MEAAQRYFNLAITNNFIQGRKTQLVVAACLYIVCRTERTSHMLIDFSDILQVNYDGRKLIWVCCQQNQRYRSYDSQRDGLATNPFDYHIC